MREPGSCPGPSRVKGRPVLERRTRALLIAVTRFGEHRARTTDERRWAATMAGSLSILLGIGPSETPERGDGCK
jgi:hypothetical protein